MLNQNHLYLVQAPVSPFPALVPGPHESGNSMSDNSKSGTSSSGSLFSSKYSSRTERRVRLGQIGQINQIFEKHMLQLNHFLEPETLTSTQ